MEAKTTLGRATSTSTGAIRKLDVPQHTIRLSFGWIPTQPDDVGKEHRKRLSPLTIWPAHAAQIRRLVVLPYAVSNLEESVRYYRAWPTNTSPGQCWEIK